LGGAHSSDKITKIEALECSDANWNVWQAERDSLVNWVKINHPELDGFINDLTMNGAKIIQGRLNCITIEKMVCNIAQPSP